MNNWRDIETAPKDGTPVFLWKNQFIGVHRYLNPLGSVCGPQWYQAYGCNYAAFWVEGATDWMPLPQPPANHTHTSPASSPEATRCDARQAVFGRCALSPGHARPHQNSLGNKWQGEPEATQPRPYEIGLRERLQDIEHCRKYMIASADGGPEAITMALDDILKAQQAAEQASAGQTDLDMTPSSEDWWDQKSVQCVNCSVEIVARKSSIPKNHNALSHEEGEEELLCGYCAGEEVHRLVAEGDELRSQLAEERDIAATNREYALLTNQRLAETRGIAGALAERLMRHVCQKDDCEDASHKKDKDVLAKWKAAGISPEEKGSATVEVSK